MKTEKVEYFCDFCGRENIQSQFTKVDIRGFITGYEIACPSCLQHILEFLAKLRILPQKNIISHDKWWQRWFQRL